MHIDSYEIIDFQDFNAPKNMSTHTKLTQKVNHFTVFKSFSSTSCCSQKFPPNNLEKNRLLDVQGSIRDVFIEWVAGDGLVGKVYSSKIVVGQ